MRRRVALEHAAANIERVLGGRVVAATKLTGGSSADVYLLDIDAPADGARRVVFRQHRAVFKGHGESVTAKEFGVLAALHRRGLEVPEPVLLHAGGDDVAPYLVIEWVDGAPDVDPSARRDALEQMARFLQRLHCVSGDVLAVADVPALEDPAEVLLDHLPSNDLGARLKTALVARRRPPASNPPVLIHGDYWPGNVLWQAGRLAAVIDWEDAAIGDPLADLACARVELLCRYGADAVDHFTGHYLALSRDAGRPLRLDSLALWEAYVSAAALATMHLWGLDPGDESHRRTLATKCFTRAASELVSQR